MNDTTRTAATPAVVLASGDYHRERDRAPPIYQQPTTLKADELKKPDTEGRATLCIDFDTEQARINSETGPAMTEAMKLLQASPALRLAVEGHTDNAGTPAHNQQLSEACAQSWWRPWRRRALPRRASSRLALAKPSPWPIAPPKPAAPKTAARNW